jgi:hypothetical protein
VTLPIGSVLAGSGLLALGATVWLVRHRRG